MKSYHEYKEAITSKIKRAEFQEALDELEKFAEQIDNKDLIFQVLALHARFNTEFKKQINGLVNDYEEQNKIIFALTNLLRIAEDIVKENTTRKSQSNNKINENVEILDRYAGVYENYYLNDVGNQNFISRNIFKFYKDGTVKLKNFKNIIFNGKISVKLEGRFFVLSEFKDKDGNEYDFMSILRLPWVADEETELLGIYAGISHSAVIPKVGRDFFRRVNGSFSALTTKKIHFEDDKEINELLSQIPHLKDFFLGKYEPRNTHKYIDVIRD